MMNQSEQAIRERGGIEVRDYTQERDLKALKRRTLNQGGQGKLNFHKVARGLTVFSMGLGLMQLLMPGRMQRMIGIRRGDYSGLMRLMGARELLHGLLIFAQARPHRGVWSRVAGDALDLGLLGAAYTTPHAQKNRVAIAAASVLGVTALDALTAKRLSRQHEEVKKISSITNEDLNHQTRSGAFKVNRSVTVNRSPEELYHFWRNFENFPRFMYHLEEVRVKDDRRSHWVASGPGGVRVSWDAEITEDRPNERIAWRSLDGADVPNNGVVRFEPAPGGRGTVVHVEMEYSPPGGAIGRRFAKLFGQEPAQQIKGDMNRFKQVIETGEVVRSEGSHHGLGQKLQRPAQPMRAEEKRKQGKSLLGKIMPGKLFSGKERSEKDSEQMTREQPERSWTR